MNRLYIVSNDGRLFFADAKSSSFELLEHRDSTELFKIKRMSASPWCFWCISSNFSVHLYVYLIDTPFEYQEVTFENQRRYNLLSSKSFTDKLLPTDRYKFSSADGVKNSPFDSFSLPSKNWRWMSDWVYEQNSTEGWEYAVDFPATYYQQFFITACVRRRKWTRSRVFKAHNEFINIQSPNETECIIDISVGGWLIPYVAKGHLSVWAISNIGKLYFRRNVSHSNLEGTNWENIKLPKEMRVFSCSCSANGDLWVSTDQGNALLRRGVSRASPTGTDWLIVDQPREHSGIKEISIGEKSVWVIDYEGSVYFRAGLSEKLEGVKWVDVSTSVSTVASLSLSHNDQIWVVNTQENKLYFRYGIGSHSPSGSGWKEVRLKYSRSYKDDESKKCAIGDNSISKSSVSGLLVEPAAENKDVKSPPPETSDQAIKTKKQETEIHYVPSSFSIYDDSDASGYIKSIYDSKDEVGDEDQIRSLIKQNSINIAQYVYQPKDASEMGKIIEETNQKLDEILDAMIKKDKENDNSSQQQADQLESSQESSSNNLETKSRPESSLMTSSSDYQILNELLTTRHDTHSKSISSMMSQDSTSTVEITQVDLHFCCANCFDLDSKSIPISWFEKTSKEGVHPKEAKEKERVGNIKWKREIILQLNKRNLKEFSNIDKISIPYENDPNWSRKDDFIMLKQGKFIPCYLEITIECEQKSKRPERTKTYKNMLNIIPKKHSNKNPILAYGFEEILVITRHVHSERNQNLCFAIYLKEHSIPLLFFTGFESKLNEWVSQISIYCFKSSDINSLLKAACFLNMDGFSYYSYFKDNHKPLLFHQIDGHFKLIEKHKSGVTFGVGENGKLWVLENRNSALESYRGLSMQSDEVEVYTFENQRWNVVTGLTKIIGLSEGFSSLALLPTDRAPWSDEHGRVKRRKEDCSLPSTQFRWVSDWQVDYSLQPGVDSHGWQYAINWPNAFHGTRYYLSDYVRRRRWVRKCRIESPSLWEEVHQARKLTSISLDLELDSHVIIWATDSDGSVVRALVDTSNSSQVRWRHIQSIEKFEWVSIGVGPKVWAVGMDGNVYYRNAVNSHSDYCGRDWNQVMYSEAKDVDVRFKMLSVGDECVWAVSRAGELYFRENVSKALPLGTSWTRVDRHIKFVSVNHTNEVYAVTDDTHETPDTLLYREGINEKHLMGKNWSIVISMKCKMFSNRGIV